MINKSNLNNLSKPELTYISCESFMKSSELNMIWLIYRVISLYSVMEIHTTFLALTDYKTKPFIFSTYDLYKNETMMSFRCFFIHTFFLYMVLKK